MMRHIQIMQKLALLALLTVGGAACNVHEWPDTETRERVSLKLTYATAFTQQAYTCEGAALTETGDLTTTDNTLTDGYMHYTVRVYAGLGTTERELVDEVRFTRSVAGGYDCEVPLELAAGSYTIRVWSMLTATERAEPYYEADDFAEIGLVSGAPHAGSTDYRDAFRGMSELTIDAYSSGELPAGCRVSMERPLAKYEFVATDAAEFLAQAGEGATLSDYEAVFRYAGYTPTAYNMFSDKPSDSAEGVVFRSALNQLSATEFSLGFDYVFVNGTESSVRVLFEVYKQPEGTLIARSNTIRVPLRRSRYTVVRGKFLTAGSSGGVGIDPGFDDDFNIPL